MLVRFQLHDVSEGDDKSATFFENLTGKDDWAELLDTTGQTFEKTCTIGFLFSAAQKVETAAIQEDDAFFGSQPQHRHQGPGAGHVSRQGGYFSNENKSMRGG